MKFEEFKTMAMPATTQVRQIEKDYGREFVPEDLRASARAELETNANIADANLALAKLIMSIKNATGIDIRDCEVDDLEGEPVAIRLINIWVRLRENVTLAIVRTYNSIEVSIKVGRSSYWLCKMGQMGQSVELARRVDDNVSDILAEESCDAETRAFTAWFVKKVMAELEATFPKTERDFGL